MNYQIKRALLSVYDKTGLLELAQALKVQGVEILSSGGTAKYLRENGLEVIEVSDLTGSPEVLGGRVKTMHPRLHAGILAKRDEPAHLADLVTLEAPLIDLVVVNLYPFQSVLAKEGASEAEILENIDIGGPALLRAAAKNYKHVFVLANPDQYTQFVQAISANELTQSLARNFAKQVFETTSAYEQAISAYFAGQDPSQETLKTSQFMPLRYGENPHQTASLLRLEAKESTFNPLSHFKQLQGKELSYNNWLDLEAGWSLLGEFESEIPACGIVKHNSPCGVALGETALEAFQSALEADPISAFGGIVALNCPVDQAAAKMMSEIFLEVILAPSFSAEALEILATKKNLRLVQLPQAPTDFKYTQYRSVLAHGLLRQENDHQALDKESLQVVTEAQPEPEDWLAALFAFRVVKHVRSNAIVLVNGNKTVGIGAGQTNRVNAVRLAIENACDQATGSTLASDAFFPFPDSVELAAMARVRCIIQPGGSIKDPEVIAAANKYKIPMIFTGLRHFRH